MRQLKGVYARLFDKPVVVKLPGDAARSIKSVGHAADLLFDKWPLDTPFVATARAACLKASVSPKDIAQAKMAFENAAREANILVAPGSDGPGD